MNKVVFDYNSNKKPSVLKNNEKKANELSKMRKKSITTKINVIDDALKVSKDLFKIICNHK